MTGITSTTRSWWKRLNKTLLDSEAAQFLQEHGNRASELVKRAARIARNRDQHRQARHYAHLALRISELSEQKLSKSLTRANRPLGPTVPPTRMARADEVIE
jgi:hypothetical protein